MAALQQSRSVKNEFAFGSRPAVALGAVLGEGGLRSGRRGCVLLLHVGRELLGYEASDFLGQGVGLDVAARLVQVRRHCNGWVHWLHYLRLDHRGAVREKVFAICTGLSGNAEHDKCDGGGSEHGRPLFLRLSIACLALFADFVSHWQLAGS